MAAKVESKKKGLPMPVTDDYEMPSRMTVNMDKMKGMDGCQVGEKCKMMVEGVITSRNQDEYRNSMDLDLSKIKYMGGMDDGDSEDENA